MAENQEEKRTEKSCWYYDNQMLDRMTCVSLHANTYLTKKDDGSEKKIWRQYSDKTKEGGIAAEVDAGGYCKTPLCTSILGEDFQVSIANTWSDAGGSSDIVGDLWNKARGIAPYTKAAAKIAMDVGNKADKWRNSEGKKDRLAELAATGLSNFGKVVEKVGDDAVDYLNSVLISQGTRFKYYAGTGLSFGNLQMRFTMFPIWTDEKTFLTVPQQLEQLFPYVIGSYDDFSLEIKKETNEVVTTNWLGWQKPPSGYQADMKDIDKAGIKGTLKLRIGSFYVLESLVCESLNFNLSRQMVKKPEKASWTNLSGINVDDQLLFSPLSADVVMSFSPATKYSDRVMRKFIYGLNIGGDVNEGGREASLQLSKNLEMEKQRISRTYKIEDV